MIVDKAVMTAMQCLLFGAFCFYVRYVCAVNMLSNWTVVLLCGPCLCIRRVEQFKFLRHWEGHGFQALSIASNQMLCVYAGQKCVQTISCHTLMACDACYV